MRSLYLDSDTLIEYEGLTNGLTGNLDNSATINGQIISDGTVIASFNFTSRNTGGNYFAVITPSLIEDCTRGEEVIVAYTISGSGGYSKYAEVPFKVEVASE